MNFATDGKPLITHYSRRLAKKELGESVDVVVKMARGLTILFNSRVVFVTKDCAANFHPINDLLSTVSL